MLKTSRVSTICWVVLLTQTHSQKMCLSASYFQPRHKSQQHLSNGKVQSDGISFVQTTDLHAPFTPGIKIRSVSRHVIRIINHLIFFFPSFAFTPGIFGALSLSSLRSGVCPPVLNLQWVIWGGSKSDPDSFNKLLFELRGNFIKLRNTPPPPQIIQYVSTILNSAK